VTTKAKGTGLGLAIVKKIVDEHHGDIHVANRSPHGAEVRIRLQLAPAGDEAHAAGGAQDAPAPHA
jgi:nitrogen fixation/metabolism regulation signal transduction histidine kinase